MFKFIKFARMVMLPCVIVFVLLGTACLFMMPKIWESTATIQVVYPEVAEGYEAEALEHLTGTQVQRLLSMPIKAEVAQRLNLAASWGEQMMEDKQSLNEEDTLTILGNNLKVETVPGTIGLIKISVTSEDPEEAAIIANEMAHVYKERTEDLPQQGGTYAVEVVEPAEPSRKPSSPDFIGGVLSAIVFGLFMGFIISLKLYFHYGNREEKPKAKQTSRVALRKPPESSSPESW